MNSSGTFLAPLLTFQDYAWAANLNSLSLNMVNYLIVLTLLFLSFVNILHINIDTYGIKKTMPMLVMGVVLANFANLICRLIVDFSDVLTASIVGNPGDFVWNLGSALGFGQAALQDAAWAIGVGGLVVAGNPAFFALGLLTVILIELFPFFLLFYLMVLFIIRKYVVLALVAIAPLAFAALGTPLTQEYFKKWWDMFLRWSFMAPITFLVLRIGTFAQLGSNATSTADDSSGFSGFLVAAASVYFSVRIPFMLGGDLMNQWGGLVHKVGGWAGKTADYNIGKLSQKMGSEKPLTFQGLYKGWKRRGEEREHELQGEAEATGMAASEAVNRAGGFMAPAKLLKAALGGKEGLKAFGGEVQEAYRVQDQKALSLITSRLATEAEGMHESAGEVKNEDLDKSINNGDYEAAKRYALILARRGELELETWKKMKSDPKFKKEHGGEIAAMDSLIPKLQLKAERGKHFFSSTMTKGNDGKMRAKTDEEQAEHDVEQRLRATARMTSQTASSHITLAYDQIKDKRFDQLNAEERKVHQYLRELGEGTLRTRLGDEAADKIVNFSPKITRDLNSLGLKDDSRDALRAALNRGSFGQALNQKTGKIEHNIGLDDQEIGKRLDNREFAKMVFNVQDPEEWTKIEKLYNDEMDNLQKELNKTGVKFDARNLQDSHRNVIQHGLTGAGSKIGRDALAKIDTWRIAYEQLQTMQGTKLPPGMEEKLKKAQKGKP